jgi:hypothetical protein
MRFSTFWQNETLWALARCTIDCGSEEMVTRQRRFEEKWVR